MAERKSKGTDGGSAGKRDKKSKRAVIDVGDKPADGEKEAEKDSDEEDSEAEQEEGLDTDLAAAAEVVDVEPTVDDEEIEKAVEAKEARGTGSLARRDPMAAYMRETRRYPLLTP